MQRKPIGIIATGAITLLIAAAIAHRLIKPQRAASKNRSHIMVQGELKALPNTQPATLPASTRQSEAAGVQTWTGIAESRKAGLFLFGANVYVELPGRFRWPDTADGRPVVVTGRAVVRHDLPVFIVPKDGYPPGTGPPAGIPMPEGTDLYKASERTVIEDAQWHLADER